MNAAQARGRVRFNDLQALDEGLLEWLLAVDDPQAVLDPVLRAHLLHACSVHLGRIPTAVTPIVCKRSLNTGCILDGCSLVGNPEPAPRIRRPRGCSAARREAAVSASPREIGEIGAMTRRKGLVGGRRAPRATRGA